MNQNEHNEQTESVKLVLHRMIFNDNSKCKWSCTRLIDWLSSPPQCKLWLKIILCNIYFNISLMSTEKSSIKLDQKWAGIRNCGISFNYTNSDMNLKQNHQIPSTNGNWSSLQALVENFFSSTWWRSISSLKSFRTPRRSLFRLFAGKARRVRSSFFAWEGTGFSARCTTLVALLPKRLKIGELLSM